MHEYITEIRADLLEHTQESSFFRAKPTPPPQSIKKNTDWIKSPQKDIPALKQHRQQERKNKFYNKP